MELELGLKITQTRDDLTSTTDLRVTNCPSGPLFLSKEIDTMFMLVGHLNGFRRENIDIEINKHGNRIAIGGKKAVQEMVLMGWIMCKKEAVMRTFKKVFRIPDGVILDKIKAKFNDETSTLTIRMPKLVKGISGVGIQEVDGEDSGEVVDQTIDQGTKIPEGDDYEETVRKKPDEPHEQIESRRSEDATEAVCNDSEEPEVKSREDNYQVVEQQQGRPEIEQQYATEKVPTMTKTSSMEPKEETEKETERSQAVEPPPTEETQAEKIPEERASKKGLEHVQSTKSIDDQVIRQLKFPSSSSTQVEDRNAKPEELQNQEPKAGDQTIKEVHEGDQTQAGEIEETSTHQENLSREKFEEHEWQKVEEQKSLSEEAAQEQKLPRKSKVCAPIVIAGSSFLVSIIVLVIHLIRANKR